MTMVFDRRGRLTDETLAGLEEALVANPDVMAKFLDDLEAITRPRLSTPAALVAAGARRAGANRALTDENLPEEVPALNQAGRA